MKIAIIGAGFCGLATAWHLLQKPSVQVTLFDEKEIGQGTSGIAAGLLHPFAGAHSKYNWQGLEGLEATKELLQVASNAAGKSVTASNRGILRLALTEEQRLDFQACATKFPKETQWIDPDRCQQYVPGCVYAPALWIKEGLTVYSSLYLQGLWKACSQRGAQFKKENIRSLKELDRYDGIIITAGAKSIQIEELATVRLKSVKGQLLEMEWPLKVPPLHFTLNSHIYILMSEGGKSCLVGATFEKSFSHQEVDLEIAKKEILPKIAELFPPLEKGKILKGFSGLRAVAPNHLPMIQEISPCRWLLTGMGSKGLLYHALFAKQLAEKIEVS